MVGGQDCHALDAVASRHAAAAVLEPDAPDLCEASDPEAGYRDRHELDVAGDHHAVAAVLKPENPQPGSVDAMT